MFILVHCMSGDFEMSITLIVRFKQVLSLDHLTTSYTRTHLGRINPLIVFSKLMYFPYILQLPEVLGYNLPLFPLLTLRTLGENEIFPFLLWTRQNSVGTYPILWGTVKYCRHNLCGTDTL